MRCAAVAILALLALAPAAHADGFDTLQSLLAENRVDSSARAQ